MALDQVMTIYCGFEVSKITSAYDGITRVWDTMT